MQHFHAGWCPSPSPRKQCDWIPAPEKENSFPSPAQETFHKTFQNSYLRIIRSKDMPAHMEKKSDQTAKIVAWLITAVK